MTDVQFQWRLDSAADWTAANPVLIAGEPGMETDTGKVKVGDGVTAWNSLGYFPSSMGNVTVQDLTAQDIDADTITVAGQLIAPPTAWTLLDLENDWVNYGLGYAPAAWRLNGDVMEFRGSIKDGVSGTVAFIIDPGLRPPAGTEEFSGLWRDPEGYIDVQTDGQVFVTTSDSAYVSIDLISYSITL